MADHSPPSRIVAPLLLLAAAVAHAEIRIENRLVETMTAQQLVEHRADAVDVDHRAVRGDRAALGLLRR